MKSERRHELQHNQLAEWLASTGKGFRPYQNWILGGLVLVAVIAAAVTFFVRTSAAKNEDAWDQFARATEKPIADPDDFEAVVADFPGTTAAPWAALRAGEIRLSEGCYQLYIDKVVARKQLERAQELFESVRSDAPESAVRQRATFGLARVLESLGGKDEVTQAKELYGDLIEKWPDGAYSGSAKYQLVLLEKSSTQDFLDRFAQWEPEPLPPEPLDGSAPYDPLSADPLGFPREPGTPAPSAAAPGGPEFGGIGSPFDPDGGPTSDPVAPGDDTASPLDPAPDSTTTPDATIPDVTAPDGSAAGNETPTVEGGTEAPTVEPPPVDPAPADPPPAGPGTTDPGASDADEADTEPVDDGTTGTPVEGDPPAADTPGVDPAANSEDPGQ